MEDSMLHLRVSLSAHLEVYPPARAGLCSLLLHAATANLLFTPASSTAGRQLPGNLIRLVAPSGLAPYLPSAHRPSKGGGGGGGRSPLPASLGRLPRFASKQFSPPTAVPSNPNPILPVEPTLIGSQIQLSEIKPLPFGDPLAPPGPPSNGPGSGGGIGNGRDGGVSSGTGPGAGPGRDGGLYGQDSKAAGARSGLAVLYEVEPDYSDEARKARLQGLVVLRLEVDERGAPRNLEVVRGLGMGLDEQALEAVAKWRFRTARRNGKPAVASAFIEVNFRLL
jgi:TonB family protein